MAAGVILEFEGVTLKEYYGGQQGARHRPWIPARVTGPTGW